MDLTAFVPYALNVRTNISSYGPRARLIRTYDNKFKSYLTLFIRSKAQFKPLSSESYSIDSF